MATIEENKELVTDPWGELKDIASKITNPMQAPIPTDVGRSLAMQQDFDAVHGRDVFKYIPLPMEEEEKPKPGFIEGIVHEWRNWSLSNQILDAAVKRVALPAPSIDATSPASTVMPENWNSMDNEDYYKRTSPKYWDLLQMAKNPPDQDNRFRYAQEQMKKEEYYASGSTFQKIVSKGIGIPAGLVIDPMNLLPWAMGVKAVGAGANILANLPRNALQVGLFSAATETAKAALDPDVTMADAALNTVYDTMAGTFLLGFGNGISGAYRGFKLRDAGAKAFKANGDGIEPRYNLTENGEIINANAFAAGDMNLSAAKLSNADIFFASKFSQDGLFVVPKMSNVFAPTFPIMRGLNSSYAAMNHYTNSTFKHPINTIGGKKTVVDGIPFQTKMDQLEGRSINFGIQMDGLRKQYNGINLTSSEKDALKNFKSAYDKHDPLDAASFGFQVSLSAITQDTHSISQVNEGVKAWHDFTNPIRVRYQQAYGLDAEHVGTWHDEGYFSRVYNRYSISHNKKGFIESGVSDLIEQDQIITRLTRPINELNDRIKRLENEILAGTNVSENQIALEIAKENRKIETEALHEELRNNKSHIIMLDEAPLSSKDSAGLKSLLAPLEKLKKEQKELQETVSGFKSARSRLKSRMTRKPSSKKSEEKIIADNAKYRAEMEKLEAEIQKYEADLNLKKEEVLNEESLINGKAQNGIVPKSWFFKNPETGRINFKDPSAPPKFRPLYENREHMEQEMQGLWETLMGLSDEQIAQQAMKGVNNFFSTDSAKQRTVMLRTKNLLMDGWLSTDLPEMAHNYAMSLGKHAAMEESLSQFKARFGTTTGLEGVYKALRDDYMGRLRNVDKLPQNQQEKARNKVTTEYQKTVRLAEKMNDALLGIPTGDKEVRMLADTAKNLAYSAKGGFIPLTQIADMGAIVFKNSFWGWFRDGFAKSIVTLNNSIKTKGAINRRAMAEEALIGLEGYRTNMTNKFYSGEPYSDLVPNSSISQFINKKSKNLAQFTSKYTLSNALENFNRYQAANVVQSRITKLLYKQMKGELSERQRRNLSLLGIEAEEWAPIMTKQVDTHGNKGVLGGYESNFHLWTDTAAKNKMGAAVLTGTNDSIIKKQAGMQPFWMSNPTLSIITQFMGWSFAAFGRFTIPMMQRADANMAIGTVMMGLVGSIEECLRKLARGEEVDLNSDELMVAAFSNSAPFVLPYKAAMLANALIESPMLDKIKNDKHRNILQLGMVGGAAFGYAKDFASGLHMFGSGNWNQQDFKQFSHVIPTTQWWYTYNIWNKFIEGFTESMPRTRQQGKSN